MIDGDKYIFTKVDSISGREIKVEGTALTYEEVGDIFYDFLQAAGYTYIYSVEILKEDFIPPEGIDLDD